MQKLSLVVFLLLNSFLANAVAQTYTGSGGIIPDNGTAAYFSIEPASLGASVVDTNYGVLSVCININHPYVSDLEVALISPDGTQVMLTYANGGDGDNYTNTCFNDRADQSIAQGSAPFTGTFRPNEVLGYVNNGQNSWHMDIVY